MLPASCPDCPSLVVVVALGPWAQDLEGLTPLMILVAAGKAAEAQQLLAAHPDCGIDVQVRQRPSPPACMGVLLAPSPAPPPVPKPFQHLHADIHTHRHSACRLASTPMA